ncbi:MAG: hypothetical protein HY671_04955 [Chloroflexi bacterium]|nr:hypothetical protein [Chloroflexota bacterium]
MADIDVKAEQARLEAELAELNVQLEAIETRRQEIVNEIVQKQGIKLFLEKLDGRKPQG